MQSLICNVTMIVVVKVTGVKLRARSRFHDEFARTSVVQGCDDNNVMTMTALVMRSQFDLLQ